MNDPKALDKLERDIGVAVRGDMGRKLSLQKPFVAEQLEAKAKLFADRHSVYGDNYHRFGEIMKLLIPEQIIHGNDANALCRLGIFVQIVSKITRYGENFSNGGHDDSLDDLAVYAMMLKELDTKMRALL